jgi:anaphase-promoting complex subunit 2
MQVRNIELLKLRFGENNLYFCEVMIKDIADSKRINSLIVSQLDKERAVEGSKVGQHS